MGSSSVSCGASNLTITCGEPMVLLLLNKRKHNSCGATRTANLVSNDGPMINYEPIALPIFGSYDDYGGIEDIEKDDNTAALEAYFGCDIETLCGIVTEGVKPSKKEFGEERMKYLSSLTGMFIHRKIYDRMVQGLPTYGSTKERLYDRYEINPKMLELIGCNKTDEDTGDKRHKQMFRHPNAPSVELHCDGNWTNFARESDGKMTGGYFRDLIALLNRNGATINTEEVQSLTHFDLVIGPEIQEYYRKRLGIGQNAPELPPKPEVSQAVIDFANNAFANLRKEVKELSEEEAEKFLEEEAAAKGETVDKDDFFHFLNVSRAKAKPVRDAYQALLESMPPKFQEDVEAVNTYSRAVARAENEAYRGIEKSRHIEYINIGARKFRDEGNPMDDIYGPSFAEGKNLSLFKDHRELISSSWAVNVMFRPTFCGPQFGETEASLIMAQTMMEICQGKLT